MDMLNNYENRIKNTEVQTKTSFVNKVEAEKNAQQSKIETPQFDLDDEQKGMVVTNVLKRFTDPKINAMRQAIADIKENEPQGFSVVQGSKITKTVIRMMSDMYNPGENRDLSTNSKVINPAIELTKVLTTLLAKNPNNNKFRTAAEKDTKFIEATVNTYTAVENAITSGKGQSR